MSIASARQVSRGPLRAAAETQLNSGSLPSSSNSISMQTLELLFRLACSPETAADGLKLLHELQVHQIELDLQHAQLEADVREAGKTLSHYKTLYELAPAGYLVTDTTGHIAEANEVAAGLLGVDRKRLVGRMLESVLSPASRPVIGTLRQQLLTGTTRVSGVAARIDPGAGALQVTASLSPAGDALLVILTPA